MFATTLSDSESSNSDVEGVCDSDGNYSASMAITMVDYRDELSELVDDIVYILKEKKMTFQMMRMCTSMRVIRILNKCTMCCLKIMANILRLPRV